MRKLITLNRVTGSSLAIAIVAGFIALTAAASHADDAAPVYLRIEGASETYFAGQVSVGDCAVIDTSGASHEFSGTAICAMTAAAESAELTYDLKDFGFGLFLGRISSDVTPADFSNSWVFWINDAPASTGLDAQAVASGDELLLAFTSFPGVPLRLTAPATIAAGDALPVTVEALVGAYNDQWQWEGTWQPAAGATVQAAGREYPADHTGSAALSGLTASEVELYATAPSAIRSARQTATVTAAATSPAPTPSPTPSPTPTPNPSPSPSASPFPSPLPSANRERMAEQALAWLRTQQATDGSIDGPMVTAWSAVAFGSSRVRADDVRSAGSSLADALADAPLNSATDIERYILAVRAAGLHPRSFSQRDAVAALRSHVHGGQIGARDQVNDDIFGVLALLAADESPHSTAIQAGIHGILATQEEDGSWQSIDLTAAALQALQAYHQQGGTINAAPAVAGARAWLRAQQDSHGGFGNNSASTAWAVQAIIALGEDPAQWRTATGATPWHALADYQLTSGAFSWKDGGSPSAFMTAYAVPALMQQPWPVTQLPVKNPNQATEIAASNNLALPTTTTPSRANPLPAARLSAVQADSAPVAATDIPSPQVLGAFDDTVSADQASAPQLSLFPPPPAISLPLTSADRRFAVALFGLANAGSGIAAGRLLAKLRRR